MWHKRIFFIEALQAKKKTNKDNRPIAAIVRHLSLFL